MEHCVIFENIFFLHLGLLGGQCLLLKVQRSRPSQRPRKQDSLPWIRKIQHFEIVSFYNLIMLYSVPLQSAAVTQAGPSFPPPPSGGIDGLSTIGLGTHVPPEEHMELSYHVMKVYI